MIWAATLLAAAVLTSADPMRVRIRAGEPGPAPTAGRGVQRRTDPLAAASSYDVLASCLAAGMAVSTAASATAASAPRALADLLNRAADLLALGADPAIAWSNAGLAVDTHGEALLRLARRSASSGTALARGVEELAEQSRHDAVDAAGAAAERASVLIAGPLGLCYLPAFLCLGIVPVVAGLAGDVLRSGLM